MSKLPILGRIRSVLEAMRSSYWFLPTLMALGAVAAAFGLVELDSALDLRRVPSIGSIDASNTISVLSVIAGSMITVIGVVFSITIVALTLASSQFGPRILRNFLRDRTNQVAFGTFVSTFLYSLLVLRAVGEEEVPRIATAVAVTLAVVSLFVLVYFIHHTARSIQASTVIASVAKEIDELLPELFPDEAGEEPGGVSSTEAFRRRVSADGVDILAPADGYIRVLDIDAVLGTAVREDLALVIHYRPGDFVYKGISLARSAPADAVTDEVASSLRDSFVLGDHRTPVQDLRMVTGQLSEIALRALSPGVNDPRTANDCVLRLGAVVCAAARREMPRGLLCDESGQPRVIVPHMSFEEIVAECFDPIRRYGIEHVQVVVAMFDALGHAAERCHHEERRRNLTDYARKLHRDFEAHEHRSAFDVKQVQQAFDSAMKRLCARSSADIASHST